ncbi:MAG: FHA domain-containing protein, partial [Chloroflexota bacterium]|nr:FHA domain-containing protein [Chloroflexota bacterium]
NQQQPAAQPQNQGGWNAQQPSQPAWNQQQPDPMAQPTVQRGGPRGGAPHLSERKPDGTGREFDLRKERLTIGRHRDSDVFLEDLAVSRLNTTISHNPNGAFILKDENSANGTYVNGERVTEHTLQDGDEVQVGQTTLIFHQ